MSQGNLFGGPPPAEESASSPADGPVWQAKVLPEAPIGLLDYRLSEELRPQIVAGAPVEIPLGRRKSRGFVVEIFHDEPAEGIRLKAIAGLDTERPVLPAKLLELVVFTADYYGVAPGEVLQAALPAMERRAAKKFVLSEAGRAVLAHRLKPDDERVMQIAEKFEKGFTVAAVEKDLGWTRRKAAARLRALVKKQWLVVKAKNHGPRKALAYRRIGSPDTELLSPQQKAIRRLLQNIPAEEPELASVLAASHPGVYKKLKLLEELGLVERSEKLLRVRPALEPTLDETRHDPTPAQQTAIDAVCEKMRAGEFETFLLEGVTGSGKTEVYLQIIEEALAHDHNALVLVPEIALTPQLGARFRERFGDQVATFHSGLTTAERRDEWERVLAGDARIGLGARSAIFLPMENIGVIIVDEEHESSFKQDENPRYNARDLAVYRAHQENAVTVLGSATPSLESRHNADQQKYHHLRLPERVQSRPMPEVKIVDLGTAARVGEGLFTERLTDAIRQTVANDDQVILFLNRRGFAPYVYCRDCGFAFRCDDCDVSLTLHRRRELLMCHHCGFELRVPDDCPSCHSLRLESQGIGIEKVEAEIKNLFGAVPVARLDRDTIRKRADLDRELTRFRAGEAKILLGTQMVTKGHDFAGVTLVGVLSADSSLNFPDFRAAERTFQLLTQVAGRAGRGDRAGRVLVQAYDTEHYAVKCAAKHDYEAFVEHELNVRHELRYPPFSHLVLLRFEAALESKAQGAATEAAECIRAHAGEVSVLGPAAAPLARLRGLYRFQVLLKGPTRVALRNALRSLPPRPPKDIRRIVDVDPLSML